MGRSNWKGLFVDTSILKHIKVKTPKPIIVPQEKGEDKIIYPPLYVRIRSRISAIPEFYLNKSIQVGIYNGKEYKTLSLEVDKSLLEKDQANLESVEESLLDVKPEEIEFGKEKYLGYKFGEFSFTRKHAKNSKRQKKEQKKSVSIKTKAKSAKKS